MGRMRPDEKTRKVLAIVRECLNETTFLKVARQTGLNPSHLYRAFGDAGNPCVSTFFNVCDALEMDVRLVPREPKAQGEAQESPSIDQHAVKKQQIQPEPEAASYASDVVDFAKEDMQQVPIEHPSE